VNTVKVYTIWLIGVIVWNFGFPNAKPVADVVAAILLSLISYKLSRAFK
tara:strand:- start:515 stop:661 length:147 start_codon:yes stop_codon:yes gene_type:complete